MPEYSFFISEEYSNKRLDKVVSEYAAKLSLGLSRTYIKKIINNKAVKINGKPITCAHRKVLTNEKIEFFIPEQKSLELQPQEIAISVLYSDNDIVVVDKPAGMVVHPGAGNQNNTLVNALLARFPELSSINPLRPGIVHRLDKETSGVMVVARNNTAHLKLAKQFSEHTIKRIYLAIVRGIVSFDEQLIELPIGRNPYRRKQMAVAFSNKVRQATTYCKVLKRFSDTTLVELRPFTGRTHQLRVHLAYLGYPILGDPTYGTKSSFTRMALHAIYLGFIHPTKEKFVEFCSPLPVEFEEYLKNYAEDFKLPYYIKRKEFYKF
ncbi:MAG: RluA family pseudouridine synthase [Candidatus Omnitrophica bacterium]|nr:RluA family pseudouridine synthase [Candidatus Omnitrophota bacterium]